ncbi:MAG: bifunctional phosphoglucose/phosphomannose isomerase [Candidatus Omnitrophota bacterium]
MIKLNLSTIKKLDKSNMLGIILDFPGLCKEGYENGLKFKNDISIHSIKNIIFCGLGGSAQGADLIRSFLLDKISLPMVVDRDYTIPKFVDSETLVFIISYSGNTEETISTYNIAKQKTKNIIVIASGGKLKEYALNDGFSFISVKPGYPPRGAFPLTFFTLLGVFVALGLTSDKKLDLDQTITVLENLKKELSPEVKNRDNLAKRIALDMVGRFTVIYSANEHFDAVVTRFRGQLAENAKSLSSSALIPEMNHNEIVGWENPKKIIKNFVVLILRDSSMHERVLKRIEITKRILSYEAHKVIEINSEGESLLSRICSLIYIGDFISLYLAILNKIDPTPVKRIDFLKNELAKE